MRFWTRVRAGLASLRAPDRVSAPTETVTDGGSDSRPPGEMPDVRGENLDLDLDSEEYDRAARAPVAGPGRLSGLQKDLILALIECQRDPRRDCSRDALQATVEDDYQLPSGALNGPDAQDNPVDLALNDLLDAGVVVESSWGVELTDTGSAMLCRRVERDARRSGLRLDPDGTLRVPDDGDPAEDSDSDRERAGRTDGGGA